MTRFRRLARRLALVVGYVLAVQGMLAAAALGAHAAALASPDPARVLCSGAAAAREPGLCPCADLCRLAVAPADLPPPAPVASAPPAASLVATAATSDVRTWPLPTWPSARGPPLGA
jgi:hypothetical protein